MLNFSRLYHFSSDDFWQQFEELFLDLQICETTPIRIWRQQRLWGQEKVQAKWDQITQYNIGNRVWVFPYILKGMNLSHFPGVEGGVIRDNFSFAIPTYVNFKKAKILLKHDYERLGNCWQFVNFLYFRNSFYTIALTFLF